MRKLQVNSVPAAIMQQLVTSWINIIKHVTSTLVSAAGDLPTALTPSELQSITRMLSTLSAIPGMPEGSCVEAVHAAQQLQENAERQKLAAHKRLREHPGRHARTPLAGTVHAQSWTTIVLALLVNCGCLVGSAMWQGFRVVTQGMVRTSSQGTVRRHQSLQHVAFAQIRCILAVPAVQASLVCGGALAMLLLVILSKRAHPSLSLASFRLRLHHQKV